MNVYRNRDFLSICRRFLTKDIDAHAIFATIASLSRKQLLPWASEMLPSAHISLLFHSRLTLPRISLPRRCHLKVEAELHVEICDRQLALESMEIRGMPQLGQGSSH